MAALFNHFWIIGLLVLYANLLIGRVRMRTLVAAGRLSERAANRFSVNAAICVTVVCAAFEVASLTSGIPVQCQLLLPITDRATWPFHLLTLLFGLTLLVWVWRWGGDQTLAAVGPAFIRGPVSDRTYTPRLVRLALSGIVLVSWGGYLLARASMPVPTDIPGCSGQRSA